LKTLLKDYAGLLLTAGAIATLDQLTKHLVRTNLPMGQVFHPEFWLTQYVRIVNWHNTGMAGGLFQGKNIVFILIAFIIAGVVLYFYPFISRDERLMRLALGLVLGGALGNLIDRLSQGYVTDFFSIGNLPVLNIADASIATGSALLIFALWRQEVGSQQAPVHTAQIQNNRNDKSTTTKPGSSEETQGE
jgi:signal peptidase II